MRASRILFFSLVTSSLVACSDDEGSGSSGTGGMGGSDTGGMGGSDMGGSGGGGGSMDMGGSGGSMDMGGMGGSMDMGGMGGSMDMPLDPDTAPEVAVDRFSADHGTLMVRDGSNGLPAADAPVDFDQPPFITQGLGPAGEVVEYYNFDVQPTDPAPIYVLFEEGASMPVDGQLNIIDVIPGSAGYSDFWHVHKVTVPTGYVANTITSAAEIMAESLPMEPTPTLVNCPVVPDGSTATKRIGGGSPDLVRGWYQDQVVYYFSFEEAPLEVDGAGMVPLSPIYVSFNINPDQTDGGPASGFVSESGTMQTHNVVATLPGDADYSPLWDVNVYDNADFASVSDLTTAQAANILAMSVATPNCPIVSVP